MHQDEAADDGVDRRVERERIEMRHTKRHVPNVRLPRTLCRGAHRRGYSIDPDHTAAVADQFRGEEADVTSPAADVEDAHTGAKAGTPQRRARDVGEECALLRQPRQLVWRVAKDITSQGA
jgi:hypothetical protein